MAEARSFDDFIEKDLGWRGFGPAQWVLLLIGGLAYVTMGAVMFLNVFQVGTQSEWLCVAPDASGLCGGSLDAGRALLSRLPTGQLLQPPPTAPTSPRAAAHAPFGPSTAAVPNPEPAATAATIGTVAAAAVKRQLRSSSGAAAAAPDAAAPGASMCGLSPGTQYVWAHPTLTLASEYNLVCGDTWKAGAGRVRTGWRPSPLRQ